MDFWNSVRDRSVIEKAVEGRLGEDLRNSRAPAAEVSAAAGAVLASGMEIERLLGFGELLMDVGGGGGMLGDIARAGYEKWKASSPAAAPSFDLVKLLVSAGMLSEAVEAAWSRMDDRMLALVREGLQKKRASASGTGVAAARDLLLSGKAAEALAALPAGADESAGAADVSATALWRLGRRSAAIDQWIEAFRRTGDPLLLQRLHWALGEAGYPADRAALERFVESRHRNLITSLGGGACPAGRLSTISTV